MSKKSGNLSSDSNNPESEPQGAGNENEDDSLDLLPPPVDEPVNIDPPSIETSGQMEDDLDLLPPPVDEPVNIDPPSIETSGQVEDDLDLLPPPVDEPVNIEIPTNEGSTFGWPEDRAEAMTTAEGGTEEVADPVHITQPDHDSVDSQEDTNELVAEVVEAEMVAQGDDESAAATNILQDNAAPLAILSGAEITSALLPEARRGGLEAGPVVELLHRAATTIDSLYSSLEKQEVEIREMSDASSHEATSLRFENETLKAKVVEVESKLAESMKEVESLRTPTPEQERERQAQESSRILSVADRTAAALVQEAKEEAEGIIKDAEKQQAEMRERIEQELRQSQLDATARLQEAERLASQYEAAAEKRRQELDAELAAKKEAADEVKVSLIRNIRDLQENATAERDRMLGDILELAEKLERFSAIPVDESQPGANPMPAPSGNPVATGPVVDSPWWEQ